MVLLTVSGMIGSTQSRAARSKRDSLLAMQKADSKAPSPSTARCCWHCRKAASTAQPSEFDKPATFKGPQLREVLGRVEAAKVKVTFVAVDGYSDWLMPEDIDSSDWILALEADGVPLILGQQGPSWLINTRDPGFKPDDMHHAHWVWRCSIYILASESSGRVRGM